MKKTILFTLALFLATATMAQNRSVFINETFDDATLPAGWSVAGLGTSNWNISPTNNAGGQANELHLYWDPDFNGISRMVMPAVDLTGVSSVMISFQHALDNYQGSSTIGIATSSDGGTTWNNGWTQAYNTSGSWTIMQEMTTPDMGHDNVKFCLFFSGRSYNMNDWFFDNIQIFTLENLDLGINAVNMPTTIANGEQTVSFNVMNFGSTTITNFEATYEVDGFEPVTEAFEVELASMASTDMEFTVPIDLSPETYHMTITLNSVNGSEDDDLNDNTVAKNFTVAYARTQKYPMIEHFSASTCGPCVQPNIIMHNFCNNNEGRYTYTKYQMNWPGSGDPYYTAEGGTRRTYYSVSGVPTAFLDGEVLNFNNVQNSFNQHAEKHGFMDIRGSFNVGGNTINVSADVTSYIDVVAHVFISVNEKTTYGNVGSNGETEFHHIFMKMLTSAQGQNTSFTVGETKHFEYTQDLSSTHVEEMSDLEVAIWVQNYTSKEVYNSHYAYPYTDIYPYSVENLASLKTGNNLLATWDAPSQGNPSGYNVYINNELVAENITETSFEYEAQDDKIYIVGIEALYDGRMTSVKVISVAEENLQDLGLITTGSSNVILDIQNPSLDLSVQNANFGTNTPIQINSIAEGTSEGGPYLEIEPAAELPYVLETGEEFHFTISPISMAGRSFASTSVNVNYDGGTINFLVEIDGELLSISEISSTAKVYPNPANGQVRIESAKGIESVMVYNMMGVLVETIPANSMMLNVNLSKYSEGTYFFNIRQSDGTVSNQRVVVRH